MLADVQQKLVQKGVVFDSVEIPEASEREGYFPLSMPASIIAALGKDALEADLKALMHG